MEFGICSIGVKFLFSLAANQKHFCGSNVLKASIMFRSTKGHNSHIQLRKLPKTGPGNLYFLSKQDLKYKTLFKILFSTAGPS